MSLTERFVRNKIVDCEKGFPDLCHSFIWTLQVLGPRTPGERKLNHFWSQTLLAAAHRLQVVFASPNSGWFLNEQVRVKEKQPERIKFWF